MTGNYLDVYQLALFTKVQLRVRSLLAGQCPQIISRYNLRDRNSENAPKYQRILLYAEFSCYQFDRIWLPQIQLQTQFERFSAWQIDAFALNLGDFSGSCRPLIANIKI